MKKTLNHKEEQMFRCTRDSFSKTFCKEYRKEFMNKEGPGVGYYPDAYTQKWKRVNHHGVSIPREKRNLATISYDTTPAFY